MCGSTIEDTPARHPRHTPAQIWEVRRRMAHEVEVGVALAMLHIWADLGAVGWGGL